MAIFPQRKAGNVSMLLMGLVFAVVGGCVSVFLGFDTTLTCKRSADTCILEKTSIRGEKEVVASLRLGQLKSADVESKTSNSNKRRSSKLTYQVVLRTDEGPIPFSNTWSSDREAHQKNATRINRYLASSEESLSIVQSGKTVRILGIVFFAAGFLLLLGGLRGIFKTVSA